MPSNSDTITIEEASGLASTSTISRLSGHNRATVLKRLKGMHIRPAVAKKNEKLFPLPEAMRALIRYESGTSSADIRNIAQARKADAETRRLEGEYAFHAEEPIAWMEDLFSMMNELVQEMPCSDERKRQFAERGQAIPGKLAANTIN